MTLAKKENNGAKVLIFDFRPGGPHTVPIRGLKQTNTYELAALVKGAIAGLPNNGTNVESALTALFSDP